LRNWTHWQKGFLMAGLFGIHCITAKRWGIALASVNLAEVGGPR